MADTPAAARPPDCPAGSRSAALSGVPPSGMLIFGRRTKPAPPITAASEGTGNGHRLERDQTEGAAPPGQLPRQLPRQPAGSAPGRPAGQRAPEQARPVPSVLRHRRGRLPLCSGARRAQIDRRADRARRRGGLRRSVACRVPPQPSLRLSPGLPPMRRLRAGADRGRALRPQPLDPARPQPQSPARGAAAGAARDGPRSTSSTIRPATSRASAPGASCGWSRNAAARAWRSSISATGSARARRWPTRRASRHWNACMTAPGCRLLQADHEGTKGGKEEQRFNQRTQRTRGGRQAPQAYRDLCAISATSALSGLI